MSFYSDNENFIKIKLLSEMKGLSDEEMFSQYDSIKLETRKRLKKAYLSTDDILNFYEEAFEYVLFFEEELLMINLFFEEECNFIFNYLQFGVLSDLKLNNKLLFSYNFINYMNECSTEDEVVGFLKVELTELLSLVPSDWDSLNTKQNSIVKKYALWLMESNKTSVNRKLNNYSYLLLCKIWNYNENYNENFDKKAIIFYDTVNKKFTEFLNRGVYVNLNRIISDMQIAIQVLFFKDLNYYPILDNNTKSSNGYTLQRRKLNENVELSKFLCKSYKKESYFNIFKIFINKGDALCDKLKKEINEKLNELILPNKPELDAIIQLNLEEKQAQVKDEFLRRLYQY